MSILLHTVAFSIPSHYSRFPLNVRNSHDDESSSVLDFSQDGTTSETAIDDGTIKPCYWKSPDGLVRTANGETKIIKGGWKPRIQFQDIKVGQKLIGEKISKADFLGGKTGPKIFFECGVGRIDSKGNWQMVSGMLRVAKSYAKPSVVKKKVERLSGRPVELFVHRVYPESGQMEVKLSLEEVEQDLETVKPKFSASSLKVGQELIGKVVELKPFGCIVDVGANRNGMLHITRVAALYGRYINKEKGLEEAGLERGATIKVAVHSNENRKLILDFTQETKDIAAREAEAIKREEERTSVSLPTKETDQQVNVHGLESVKNDKEVSISEQEAAAWAAYVDNNDDVKDDEDDYYDEDEEIEDMLGIGSY
jgi:predicted RNA-binding protein with RPS1 domain